MNRLSTGETSRNGETEEIDRGLLVNRLIKHQRMLEDKLQQQRDGLPVSLYVAGIGSDISTMIDQHKPEVKNAICSSPYCLNSDPSYILHASLSLGVRGNNMLMLIRDYPSSIKTRDNNGNLPLHLVAAINEDKVEEDFFEKFIISGAKVEDKFPNEGVLRELLSSYPEAARARNNGGLLPLHVGLFHGVNSPIIHFLCNAYFGALKVPFHSLDKDKQDYLGFLPFHIACARNASLETVYELLRLDPTAMFGFIS